MPNRLIKESCRTSETLELLSAEAERMFWRLVTVADDYGRFEADPRILLANCFPLKVGTLKPAHVERWFEELQQVDAVRCYEAKGKRYGLFVSWDHHQTKRAQYSKHPSPPQDFEASREHPLPGEVDIEDALFDHFSSCDLLFDAKIVQIERQLRVAESYLDIVVKTEQETFVFELKRGRLSNKSIDQLEKYLSLVPGKGVLIGFGLAANFDLSRCQQLNIAVVTLNDSLDWGIPYTADFFSASCLPDLNVISQEKRKERSGNHVISRDGLIREARQVFEKRETRSETATSPDGNAAAVATATQEILDTPEALVVLYHAEKPSECAKVQVLSEERKKSYRKYLRQYPHREWWRHVFAELRDSPKLRGLEPSPSHPNFRADLDWLCQRGQDGKENCVKTYEGKYRSRASPIRSSSNLDVLADMMRESQEQTNGDRTRNHGVPRLTDRGVPGVAERPTAGETAPDVPALRAAPRRFTG